MKIIVVDIGNTNQKAAVYEDGHLVDFVSVPQLSVSIFETWKSRFGVSYLMYSSVGSQDDVLLKQLGGCFKCYRLQDLPLPFEMAYQTPETLGSDRLACMVAAADLYPGQPVLVVQCGSCLTFDLLSGNVYQGGSISPGLQMRFKALHGFTARLPLLELDPLVSLTGVSTQTCIQAGVWHGYLSECESMIEKYCTHYENLNIILTGGDAEMVKDKLKKSIFAHPNLVLYGLFVMLSKYVENQ